MAQPNSSIAELLLWAKDLGTRLHPAVRIYEDPATGLSFGAVEDIPPETKLVNCSYGVTLSYLNAVDAPHFARHFCMAFPKSFVDVLRPEDPNIIGHFFLMQQYLLGEKSFWWSYIRLLPQPDAPSSIPALWPEEDQRYLDGTNAEPAIKKRLGIWEEEWTKAVALLRDFQDVEQYTFSLYKWAASIFGSRSFRPSLTISESFVPDHVDHVRKDKFSVLFPVMDIGNHNGINNVEWTIDPSSGVFILSSRGTLPRDAQIFNYYGNKSNSELLVGYGFTLTPTPNSDLDAVNLKLKPEADALALRRSQHCHVIPQEAEEESMFAVQKRMKVLTRGVTRLEDFTHFSDGLVDLVVCMVANRREKKHLSLHLEYCPESDPNVFGSPLSRAILMTLQILNAKLMLEQKRVEVSIESHRAPQNRNQNLSLFYASGQLSTLVRAKSTVSTRLRAALSFTTFNEDPDDPGVYQHMHDRVELLSLGNAYEWLLISYPDIGNAITAMISEDQDEPLPLNWSVLAEDWEHAYWAVWVYTVWMLWARNGDTFRLRHHQLSSWLLDMNSAYDNEANVLGKEVLHAEVDEISTIDFMVRGITSLKQFSTADMQNWLGSEDREVGLTVATRIRNFASYVAHEETFAAVFSMQGNDLNGCFDETDGMSERKVLCITKARDSRVRDPQGRWTACMRQSPKIR